MPKSSKVDTSAKSSKRKLSEVEEESEEERKEKMGHRRDISRKLE